MRVHTGMFHVYEFESFYEPFIRSVRMRIIILIAP